MAIFCDCGEYLGMLYFENGFIEVEPEVQYNVDNEFYNSLQCPYCKQVKEIEGIIINKEV